MSETIAFGEMVLFTAAVGMAALLSNRVTERIRVPAPLLVLVTAAAAVEVFPDLHEPPEQTVERLNHRPTAPRSVNSPASQRTHGSAWSCATTRC
jgi:hypothetical protein